MPENEDIESEAFHTLLKKRNKEAFRRIYEKFKVPLYNLVFSMIKDREKTADIIQDTFIKIIKKIHQLQDIRKLKHWIFRIAVNLTINILNRDKRFSLPGDDLEVLADKMVMEDFSPQDREDPEEVRYMILEMVEQLPVKQRVVFTLKYVEDFKEVEISEILDIPVGTVKSRLNIARNRIKTLLRNS